MKRVLALLLALVGVLPATPVQAEAQTFHFRFTGQFADAFFSSTDPSGCLTTFVGVFGVDGRVKMEGRPQVESLAGTFIEQFDVCDGTLLLAAFGVTTLEPDAFQINKQLTSATLVATIEVFDYVSGTSFPVDVNLSWTGVGDALRVKDRFQIKSATFKVNLRFDGTFREAEALSSVTDGSTNFTPEPAVFAQLGSVKVGEVVIFKE